MEKLLYKATKFEKDTTTETVNQRQDLIINL